MHSIKSLIDDFSGETTMNDNEPLKVMTLQLGRAIMAQLDVKCGDLNLRRDSLFRKQLPREIEKLASLPANSPPVAAYLQQTRQQSGEAKIKVGMKLPESLIERINTVCAEKRVPRDLFVETFVEFLVKGDPDIGVDASPLDKAYTYLNDPYWDAHGDPNIYSAACRPSEEILDLLIALDKAASPAGKGR
jgi:hypothetical protein